MRHYQTLIDGLGSTTPLTGAVIDTYNSMETDQSEGGSDNSNSEFQSFEEQKNPTGSQIQLIP